MPEMRSRATLIVGIVGALLTGGLLTTLVTTISTQPDRAQLREFAEFDRLVNEISRQDARIAGQDSRIESLEGRVSALREESRMLSVLLTSSGQEITALNMRIADLEAQLLARDEVIGALRAQVEDLRSHLEALRVPAEPNSRE